MGYLEGDYRPSFKVEPISVDAEDVDGLVMETSGARFHYVGNFGNIRSIFPHDYQDNPDIHVCGHWRMKFIPEGTVLFTETARDGTITETIHAHDGAEGNINGLPVKTVPKT